MVLIGTTFVEKVSLCDESVNLNLEENLTDVLLLLYGSPIPGTIVATIMKKSIKETLIFHYTFDLNLELDVLKSRFISKFGEIRCF